MPRNALLAVDLLHVPTDGAFRAPRQAATVTGSAGVRPSLRHEALVDPGRTIRVDDQYERGDLLWLQVRLAPGHGIDVNNEPRCLERWTVIDPAACWMASGDSACASNR